MKLKNKKTGEIGYLYEHSLTQDIIIVYDINGIVGKYSSLAELSEDWEDAPEELKGYWYINEFGTPTKADFVGRETLYDKCRKNFGNYFETKEEAELVVRRLKAWKRLEDKGFRFKEWESYEETSGLSFPDRHIVNSYTAIFDFNKPCRKYEIEKEVKDDLDICFGGEK